MKKYNCGIVVGRFAPIHIGHEKIIKRALEDCNKVVLIVTSSYIKDNKNPFDIEFKIDLINKVFKNEIENGSLIVTSFYEDGNIDTNYGEKILDIAKNVALCDVDYIIYGSDKDITKCFNEKALNMLYCVKVSRTEVNISATKIREFLINDDDENLQKYLNPIIYENIDIIKEKI